MTKIYVCPNCGGDVSYLVDYIKKYGKAWCGYCGAWLTEEDLIVYTEGEPSGENEAERREPVIVTKIEEAQPQQPSMSGKGVREMRGANPVLKQPIRAQAVEAEVIPVKPLTAPRPARPKVEVEKLTELKRAEERLRALERFLATTARIPFVARDDGRGETLASYRVGIANVRIAKIDEVTAWYMVSEPSLDAEDILAYATALEAIYRKAEIPEKSIALLSKRRHMIDVEEEGEVKPLDEILRPYVVEAYKTIGVNPSEDEVQKLIYYLNRELFRFSQIDTLMEDPRIEDINVIGPRIYVGVYHRDFSQYRWLWTNIYFRDDEELNDFMNRLAHTVGHGLTIAKPYADFALPGGERFAGIIGREITARGPSLTIRKFATNPYSLPYLVYSGMLSPLMAAYLWFALEQKAIIGIAGPTGSGKTTLFNALLACLHPNSTIYTIEDVYELYLPHRGWRCTTTRKPSMLASQELMISETELLKMALRMRPDYVIIGEVRSEDAVYHLLNAAFTGHGGGFTFHAGSAQEFYNRLSIMLQRTGMSETLLSFFWGCAITSYYDTPKGRLRRTIEVAEIIPAEGGTRFEPRGIFSWNSEQDSFSPNEPEETYDKSVKMQWLTSRIGVSREKVIRDLEFKMQVIEEGVGKRLFDAITFHQYLRRHYYPKLMEG